MFSGGAFSVEVPRFPVCELCAHCSRVAGIIDIYQGLFLTVSLAGPVWVVISSTINKETQLIHEQNKFRNQSLFKAMHLSLMLPIKIPSHKEVQNSVIFQNKQPIPSWLRCSQVRTSGLTPQQLQNFPHKLCFCYSSEWVFEPKIQFGIVWA